MSDKPNVSDFDTRSFLRDRGITYKDRGKNISQDWIGIRCLWCNDPSNHLGIHLYKGTINCYRCPISGTVIKLIMKVDRCNYDQALYTLKNFNRIRSTHSEIYERERSSTRKRISSAKSNISLLSQYNFSSKIMLDVHETYLKQVREFDPLYLRKKYKILFCGPLGKYRLRIIIPFYERDQAVTFTARDSTQKSPVPYINCPNAEALIDTRDTLYNLENARSQTVIVVEGAFDVWRIGDDCVATMGTKYTSAQVRLLSAFRRVFVLYDAEEEAQRNAENLCKDLNTLVSEVVRLQLPHGDPADLSPGDAKHLRKQVFGRYL